MCDPELLYENVLDSTICNQGGFFQFDNKHLYWNSELIIRKSTKPANSKIEENVKQNYDHLFELYGKEFDQIIRCLNHLDLEEGSVRFKVG